MADTEVLIVGAGPTGLVLALWLERLKVPFRIIDKAREPAEQSRALAVHARTLEIYAQLGVAEAVIARGIIAPRLAVWRDGRRVAEADFSDAAEAITPYPYVLILPQDDHERLLVERLEAAGVRIERETELADLVETDGGVRATLRNGEGSETVLARFVCGCDGAHSIVRRGMGAQFKGGDYRQVFFVADAEVMGDAADRSFNLCVDADGVCLVLPVRRTGAHRLIGVVPADRQDWPNLQFKDVEAEVRRFTGLSVRKVNWFSLYHVHHRAAERFRKGSVFLLGDAAHIHSPVGGQGMNTGIGDATNLAWKLAHVVSGRADPRLLDTYEAERVPFARKLLASTDQLFKAATDRSVAGRVWRAQVMPTFLPLLARAAPTRGTFFRTLSQAGIEYHSSRLSSGGAGRVRGGDRLPWVQLEGGDNYAMLRICDWQLQVFGAAKPATEALADELRIPLHVFPWDREVGRAGFMKNALYLVRPDGYVGFAEPRQDAAPVKRFLKRNGLDPAFGRPGREPSPAAKTTKRARKPRVRETEAM
jgi:2-polyprenyl-6-methoxyphenol hydroxylase-like FAD-dependent oxidoreductase